MLYFMGAIEPDYAHSVQGCLQSLVVVVVALRCMSFACSVPSFLFYDVNFHVRSILSLLLALYFRLPYSGFLSPSRSPDED